MKSWVVLSDRKDAVSGAALLERGLFIMEFTLPLDRGTVLLDMQDDAGWKRSFSVFADPEAGLSLLHRQGSDVRRHALPGPLPAAAGRGRLSFAFDAPARLWSLRFAPLIGDPGVLSQGTDPLPLRVEDMQTLATGGTRAQRHPAVLWFGATRGLEPPAQAPWIGLQTPVDTTRGPVAAGRLRPGDMIATLDAGPLPLRALQRMTRPSRGSFAPVLLRAPYFGSGGDLLVSADQPVLIAGAAVEYLFGEEEVLAPASLLMDGRVAQKDERRAVTTCVALDLGRPVLFTADGCCLLSTARPGQTLPRRALQDYEALPLMALLGRTALRLVA
jgi:hypothetical protein